MPDSRNCGLRMSLPKRRITELVLAVGITGFVAAGVTASCSAVAALFAPDVSFIERLLGSVAFLCLSFLIALFVTLPASLPVGLVILILRRWSFLSCAVLLLTVVTSSSLATFLVDPMSDRSTMGTTAYFLSLEWIFCDFNALGIASGMVGALVSFTVMCRVRERASESATE